MSKQNIPGIIQVDYCLASELTLFDAHHIRQGDQVAAHTVWENLHISGLAKCEVTSKRENNQQLYETKLTFYTQTPPGRGNHLFCYRLTTAPGKTLLLGTPIRPYALTESKQTYPDQPTGKQGYTVTVTYKNTHSLLSIKQ